MIVRLLAALGFATSFVSLAFAMMTESWIAIIPALASMLFLILVFSYAGGEG